MESEKEHAKLNEEKWDLDAEGYDNRGSSSYLRSMQEKIVSLLDLKKGQRLLDLGCGTGRALRYASSLINGQGEFYGIDISSKMIEIAKANASDKNMHFYKTNSDKLPFKNNFFDLIMCSNSFHHYYSPDKVLKETYRVLKPKGRIYILDPTADTLIIKVIEWLLLKRIEKGHVKLYSTKEYKSLFEKAGLQYIKSVAVAKWGLTKVHIGEKEGGNGLPPTDKSVGIPLFTIL